MFDYVKKVFRANKHKVEIETRLNFMEGAIDRWRISEYRTRIKTIGLLTSYSMEILKMLYFPYASNHWYNEAKILVGFWYLYFYVRVLEDNNLLQGKSREDQFNSAYESLVDDLFKIPSSVDFTRSKSYYLEKLEMYFKYHNVHDVPPSMIGTEMSQNVVNLLGSDDEDTVKLMSGVTALFNMVLPKFKTTILKPEYD